MYTVTPVEASMLLEKYQAILIDVRERSEYVREHIPYAISLPLSESAQWLPWLCAQEPQVWIITCLKGGRAQKVSEMLLNAFEQHPERRVYVMTGGLSGWSQAGFLTLKSDVPASNGPSCPSYRDPVQRKINAILGCILLITSYYISVGKGDCMLFTLVTLGLGLLCNAYFAWCGTYKVLNYFFTKR